MHREFRPQDMRQFDADPFAATDPSDSADGSGGLLAFTILLGLLLAADLLVQVVGPTGWRARASLLTLTAAVLGATYIVHGALAALFQKEPFVAAEVVFIALVGEVLEAVTFARTRKALGRLVEQTPRTARVRRDDVEIEIPAREVVVGDVVVVDPGERIPADGIVLAGRSTVDQSALTGESMPVDRGPSDPVFTGTLNQFGRIEVRAEKVGAETTFGQVVRLVRQARGRKADLERLADRLARYFLPAVEIAAGLTLAAGYLLGWPDVWSRAVAVLVVACPCALVLATPAAMLASMAWLARHGILIKGGYALERLAICDTFAFDKTGTLTAARPRFSSLTTAAGVREDELIGLAAAAERASRHPLAVAVTAEAAARGLIVPEIREARVLPGAGVAAVIAGPGDRSTRVLVGNARMMEEQGVHLDDATLRMRDTLEEKGETPLLVAVDGGIAGSIGLRDEVREEAHDVVHDLKHLKIKQLALLTGDREAVARRVAKQVHLKTVLAGLLPADKAGWIKERQDAGHKVAMIGDGINDAPGLAQADAGIALGGIGADLAAEAGDLIILGDPLRNLPGLVGLSRATVRVIRQNIIGFAFGLNAAAVLLAALGILSPVAAAILHQIGSLLVLLNAMRLLVYGDWTELPPVRWLRGVGGWIHRLDDSLDVRPVIAWCLRHGRGLAAALGTAVVLGYASSGTTQIGPGEVGLVQRFGGYTRQIGPGIHFRLPTPFEQVTRFQPELLRGLVLGFRGRRPAPEETLRWESSHGRNEEEDATDALLVTGDGQFLEVMASVHFTLDAASPEAIRAFVLGVDEPETVLRTFAESAVREVVGRQRMSDLLTSGRERAEEAAARLLRQRIQALNMGVVIRTVTLQDVHPPLAVVDAYRDVSRAESDRQRRINEASAYQAERQADAHARATVAIASAQSGRQRRLARASSAADAFNYRLTARQGGPMLTDFRLFWETISRVFPGKSKLILESAGSRSQRLFFSAMPPSAAAAIHEDRAVRKSGVPSAKETTR